MRKPLRVAKRSYKGPDHWPSICIVDADGEVIAEMTEPHKHEADFRVERAQDLVDSFNYVSAVATILAKAERQIGDLGSFDTASPRKVR